MIKENKRTLLISSAVILSPLIPTLIFWNDIPEQVPIHYNILGEADGFVSKLILLCFPIILLLIQWATALEYEHLFKKDPEKAKGISKLTLAFMAKTLAASAILSILIFTVIWGQGFEAAEMIIPIVVGVSFIFLGNKAPKIPQNKFVGIRIKWTLDDKDNWMKTQRLFSWTGMIGGILIIILSFFQSTSIKYAYMTIVMLLIAFIPVGYSYKLYRDKLKENQKK